MILEYDKSPNATPEQRVKSLMESVQRALEEQQGDTIINQAQRIDTQAIISEAVTQAVAQAVPEAVAQAKSAIYPVGSIYVSISSTNPGTLFGGTWVAFGTGRTLVGIDANNTAFDTVEETGGAETVTLSAEQMPSHSHGFNVTNPTVGTNASARVVGSSSSDQWAPAGFIDTLTLGSVGNNEAHNNLQPYIVVYMWKRTA